MDDIGKGIQDIIEAMDGCEATTSEEADNIMKAGYLPVDEFVRRAKAAAEKMDEQSEEDSKGGQEGTTEKNTR